MDVLKKMESWEGELGLILNNVGSFLGELVSGFETGVVKAADGAAHLEQKIVPVARLADNIVRAIGCVKSVKATAALGQAESALNTADNIAAEVEQAAGK